MQTPAIREGRSEVPARPPAPPSRFLHQGWESQLPAEAEIRIHPSSNLHRPRIIRTLDESRPHCQRLRTSSIARLFEISLVRPIPYLVTELVRGDPPDALLRKRQGAPHAPSSTRAVPKHLLVVMSLPHQRCLVHIQLNPQAVVICDKVQPVVTQFGYIPLSDFEVDEPSDPLLLAPGDRAGVPADLTGDVYHLAWMTAMRLRLHLSGEFSKESVEETCRAGCITAQLQDALLAAVQSDPSRRPADTALLYAAICSGRVPRKVRTPPGRRWRLASPWGAAAGLAWAAWTWLDAEDGDVAVRARLRIRSDHPAALPPRIGDIPQLRTSVRRSRIHPGPLRPPRIWRAGTL